MGPRPRTNGAPLVIMEPLEVAWAPDEELMEPPMEPLKHAVAPNQELMGPLKQRGPRPRANRALGDHGPPKAS